MRIRNPHRFSSFISTSCEAPPVAAVEASFPDALISNTLVGFGMKSLTESINPTPNPVVLNHHHQDIESQSNLPSSAANMAGVTKPNDNADDGSDSAELMQIQPFAAIPNKDDNDEKKMLSSVIAGGEDEIEKLRVCTVNKSPWDVPSFVRAFLTKPTTEPAEQSMQDSSRRNNQKVRIPNLPSHTSRKAKQMAEANQQAYVEDDDDFNKTEIARLAYNRKAEMKTNTMPCGKEVLQESGEEQALESALVRVFSEEVAGLTVREAGYKLMLRNANNLISEGLPLSVQVRRAMHNSPYFVQMDDGKFALWDDFLNTTVGSLDEEEDITSSEKEKTMGNHKFDREEDCATYKEPGKELGQLAESNLELAVPKIMRTKGRRSRRAGLGLGLGLVRNVSQGEEKEEIGICKQADSKRPKSCGQGAVGLRSYKSVCGILLIRNEAVHSGNNSSIIDYNNGSWDNDAVGASDSQCCYRQNLTDSYGRTHQNGLSLPDERDIAASSLVSCIKGNIGKNERRPLYYRKRKSVKSRSLKALL